MRTLASISCALIAGLVIGPAAADDAGDLAKLLKGRVAGAAQQCVTLTNGSGGPQATAGKLVMNSGSTLWVADIIGECPGLRGDPLIITEVFGSQLCHNDRFRTVTRGMSIPGAYCRIGGFTPYTKAK